MPITIQEVIDRRPSSRYPSERLEQLWAGKPSLTETEILGLKIPAIDKLWILRKCSRMDASIWRKWAQACAERAIARQQTSAKPPDPRSLSALSELQRFNTGTGSAATLKQKQIEAAAFEAEAWAVIEAGSSKRIDFDVLMTATIVSQAAHEDVEWVKIAGKASIPDELEEQVRTMQQLVASKVP